MVCWNRHQCIFWHGYWVSDMANSSNFQQEDTAKHMLVFYMCIWCKYLSVLVLDDTTHDKMPIQLIIAWTWCFRDMHFLFNFFNHSLIQSLGLSQHQRITLIKGFLGPTYIRAGWGHSQQQNFLSVMESLECHLSLIKRQGKA